MIKVISVAASGTFDDVW